MKKDEWELGRKVSYFNGTLRKLRLERGLTQGQLAEKAGLNKSVISHYETMHITPSKETAEKIANVLGVKAEKVFPEFLHMVSDYVPKTEVKYAQLSVQALEAYNEKHKFLMEDNTSPEDTFRRNDIYDKIEESLYHLTERERKVIRMRYGLDGEDPHTLEEVGNEFDVHRERIRQIEMKALSKLRGAKEIREIAEYNNLSL